MQVINLKTLSETEDKYFDRVEASDYEYACELSERVMQSLVQLDNAMLCTQMSRLDHSLQAATRAWFDGADLDWIVAALVHNIGHVHAPFDSDEYASLLLRPFVREQCSWIAKTHCEFAKYHYGAQIGHDPNERERYRGTIYFNDAVEFCDRWDSVSLDPSYPRLPLEFFHPFVDSVFSRSPYDITVTRPRGRVPLVDERAAQSRSMPA